MWTERLEDLQHPLVGRACRAVERVADHVRHVVVAGGHGIRVAQRHERDLGRRPLTDARECLQALPRVGHRHRGCFLQAPRTDCSPDDHVSTPALDAESMERPVRRAGEHRGRRRHAQVCRSWRHGAELVDELPVRLVGGVGGHLLADHSRHEHLENRAGFRNPQARMATLRVRERRLARLEACVVILLAAQRGRVLGGPCRAGAPGVDVDRAIRHDQVQRGRSLRRVRRAPHLAPAQAHRRPRPDGGEGQREVERLVRPEPRSNVRRRVVSRNSVGSPA